MVLTGRDVQWYIEQKKLVIRPIEEDQFQQNGVDLKLLRLEQRNHMFWLGVTREWIEMPDDLMAFVEIRSTWARRGYFLPPTIVDAGFKGQLTVEVLYAGGYGAVSGMKYGPSPVMERFAHLIFAKCTGPCVPYNGKYQGQTGITEAKDDRTT